jgi:hypothetical protein
MPHKEYCIEVPSLYEGHVVNNNSRWAFVAEPSAPSSRASSPASCARLALIAFPRMFL